jgi:Skp family chaperone for outer membrane proteins
MTKILAFAFLLSAAPAAAIELSLEENRAERGSVGFVDMRRLFKASPDAARAREGLEELVKQAETRVNARKAELLRLRSELDALKIEREALATSTPTMILPSADAGPAPKPEPLPPLPAELTPKVETPSPLPDPAPAPAADPALGADPAPRPAPKPLTINLPGLEPETLQLARPSAEPLDAEADKVSAPTPTPPPAPEPEPAPVPAPDPAPVAAQPAGMTVGQRLVELDGLIVGKQADLDRRQAELDDERVGAEKSLLDAEGRRSDQVLARLYRAISEVARREGVSVVMDKSATLYGHPAVDLTDKVLQQLRGVVSVQ